MRKRVFVLALSILLLLLSTGSVWAQESPEPEATEVSTPTADVTSLQNQVNNLSSTVNIMGAIIIALLVTVGISMVLLARSAPPGVIKEVAGVIGGTVIKAGAGEVLADIEAKVEFTETELDDIAVRVARQVYQHVYGVTTQPAAPAPAPLPPPDLDIKG